MRLALAGDGGRLPGDRPPDPLVVEPAEADEGPQQVPRQAVEDDAGRRWLLARGGGAREPTGPGLAVGKHVRAAGAHVRVVLVGAELVEEDQ